MLLNIIAAVTLSWTAPVERVNGQPMSVDEIGGYEIRVECPDKSPEVFTTDGLIYEFMDGEMKECDFYIAVYDTDGLYSDFVKAVTPTIRAPTRGGFRP